MSTSSSVATSILILVPTLSVLVTPGIADVVKSGQTTFYASVSGATNPAVDWSVSPSTLGTISQNGVFTAAAINADATATIVAASRENPSKTATAAVRLHNNSLYFTTQANGLQSMVYRGVDYNYKYGEGLVTSLTFSNPGGGSTTAAPTCSGTFDATTVTKNCMVGSNPASVTITYSTPSSGTLQADVQITNNSSTATITDSMISTLGVQVAQFDATKSRVLRLDDTNPIAYGSSQAGQWAIWNNKPTPDVTMNVTCGWSYVCKNQPHLTNIAPGQTKTASFSMRFSNILTLTPIQLAPEAYTAFHDAYPPVVNWPDRRPIMAWFMADYAKRSATNPRGYLQDPTIDVANTASFQSRVLGQAQSIISKIKARPIQPQGIVIWDLEGEEFIQATTYVGDPRVLSSGYAPEMNAVADQLFSLFRSAGLKVGITLRPQYLNWGTTLPSTCKFDPLNDYKDYYIKVDAPFGQRFFACYDPAGAKWSVIPQGNGGQTFYTPKQASSVTDLLMSKVAYARARWGTTLYYVDTSVSVGGAPLPADIFRTLQLAFPDSLFIPEQSYSGTMGVSIPFADPKNPSAPKFSPLSWRYIYPEGGIGVYLSNCVGAGNCWNTNLESFKIGQKIGDIAMYTQPTQMSPAQLTTVETMIQQSRAEASLVSVTDTSTGSNYSYRGSPESVYKYPLKMRVYFAASPSLMNASTTYCESGGLLGENSCSLNLSGMGTAQVRYYDYTNQFVSAEPPQGR